MTRAAAALDAVFDKVDGFFARVAARYPGELACQAGCHDCCAPDLTVTPVEAQAIAAYLRSLENEARAEIAEHAEGGGETRCAALGGDGCCSIYPVRPLVCRSHGVVVRLSGPTRHTLPVLDCCPRNFKTRDLAAIDADCILEQRTLSTLLAAVHAATRAGEVSNRVPLRDILMNQGQEGVAR